MCPLSHWLVERLATGEREACTHQPPLWGYSRAGSRCRIESATHPSAQGDPYDEYLPLSTSAVVVIIVDQHLDRVETVLGKAAGRVSKATDSGSYDKLQNALSKSGDEIGAGADS